MSDDEEIIRITVGRSTFDPTWSPAEKLADIGRAADHAVQSIADDECERLELEMMLEGDDQ